MLRTALVIFLVVGCVSVASGATGKSSAGAGYQTRLVYAGPFTADRLYQLDAARETWFASSAPKYWAKLPCLTARVDLEELGEWVGNLTEAGACAGTIEAPRWATGNYLNFLTGGEVVGTSRND